MTNDLKIQELIDALKTLGAHVLGTDDYPITSLCITAIGSLIAVRNELERRNIRYADWPTT